MPDVLEVWACPECGRLGADGTYCCGVGDGHQTRARRPIRVFREEDVRPLWEAGWRRAAGGSQVHLGDTLMRFPAPEDWVTEAHHNARNGWPPVEEHCVACAGSGALVGDSRIECASCDGTGALQQTLREDDR